MLNHCCGSGSVDQPRKALSHVAVIFQIFLVLIVSRNHLHVTLAYGFIEMPCMYIIRNLVPGHGLILIMKQLLLIMKQIQFFR
jgi:hypothetical protein